MVEVKEVFLSHEEGTKFYEVVSFWSGVTSRGAIVRRWGANGTAGDRKTEWFDSQSGMQRAAATVIEAKRKRGYKLAASGLSFNGRVPESALYLALKMHYGLAVLAKSICGAMRINDLVGDVEVGVGNEVISEVPRPEVIRGGDWASW